MILMTDSSNPFVREMGVYLAAVEQVFERL